MNQTYLSLIYLVTNFINHVTVLDDVHIVVDTMLCHCQYVDSQSSLSIRTCLLK